MTQSRRSATLDVARGGAVLAVVVFHALLFAEAAEAWSSPWRAVVGTVRLVPIPLLLLLSGYLSTRTLQDARATARRVGGVLAVYVVWTVLFVSVFAVVPYGRPTGAEFTAGGLLRELVLPSSYLWYLYGLVIGLAVLRLTWRLPAALVVGAAGVLSVLFMSGVLATPSQQVDDLGGAAVFLALGARARPALERLAARTSRRTAALVVAAQVATGGATVVLVALGVTTTWALDAVPGVGTAVALLSVAAGTSASWLVAGTRVGAGLAWLGRRSLPVYLGHEVALGLLVAALGDQLGATSGVVRHAVPPALAAAAVLASLLVHRLTRRVPVLWGPATRTPGALTDRPGTRARRGAAVHDDGATSGDVHQRFATSAARQRAATSTARVLPHGPAPER